MSSEYPTYIPFLFKNRSLKPTRKKEIVWLAKEYCKVLFKPFQDGLRKIIKYLRID
jgi:hypothetical protein